MAGHAVCGSFARAAYGIPESTWLKLTALANKGRAHLERAEGMAEFQSLARAELQQTSTNEAVQWWRQQLRMWEPMPNESCIKHPRLVWELLYKDVYVPEIRALKAALRSQRSLSRPDLEHGRFSTICAERERARARFLTLRPAVSSIADESLVR